jgi:hypothetical protein
MAVGETTRRRLLQTVGVTSIAGAGFVATSSASSGTSAAGLVEDVRYRHGWAHIAPANPEEVDILRIINPHGRQVAEKSLGKVESVASVNLLDESYVGGRWTVEGFRQVGQSKELVGRGSFNAQPSLSISDFRCRDDGWPRITFSNNGSGPIAVRAVRLADGVPNPSTTAPPDGPIAVDPDQSVMLEFFTDSLSPTTSLERSELQQYLGETVDAKIIVGTNGFGTIEKTLAFEWGDNLKSVDIGQETLWYANSVDGGQ